MTQPEYSNNLWKQITSQPKIYGEITVRDDQPEDLIEEFVDEPHRRGSITPACELYFYKLKAHHSGLVAFKDIAKTSQEMGHSYLAAVQWMRMLWKAGRVRRFYRGVYVWGKDGHSGTKYGVHYLW